MASIVFDLDGTLIDSAADIQALANAVLRDEDRAPLTLDEVRSFIGNGAAVFVSRMRVARGIPDSAQAELLAKFLASYGDAVERTEPYPAAAEALTELRAMGHRLGICTNKPLAPARAVLDHTGLLGHFDVIVGGDSTPRHKPDPMPLAAAFAGLGPGPALFVGDSETDAETSVRAGVFFALFTGGYRKSDVSAIPHDARFDGFEELPALVQRELRRGLPATASLAARPGATSAS